MNKIPILGNKFFGHCWFVQPIKIWLKANELENVIIKVQTLLRIKQINRRTDTVVLCILNENK